MDGAEEYSIEARFDKRVLAGWPVCALPILKNIFDSKGMSFVMQASPVHWTRNGQQLCPCIDALPGKSVPKAVEKQPVGPTGEYGGAG